jgi:hypothetical protein
MPGKPEPQISSTYSGSPTDVSPDTSGWVPVRMATRETVGELRPRSVWLSGRMRTIKILPAPLWLNDEAEPVSRNWPGAAPASNARRTTSQGTARLSGSIANRFGVPDGHPGFGPNTDGLVAQIVPTGRHERTGDRRLAVPQWGGQQHHLALGRTDHTGVQRRTAVSPHRILADHRRELTQAGPQAEELQLVVGDEHQLPVAVLMGVEEHRRLLADGSCAQELVQRVEQLRVGPRNAML